MHGLFDETPPSCLYKEDNLINTGVDKVKVVRLLPATYDALKVRVILPIAFIRVKQLARTRAWFCTPR